MANRIRPLDEKVKSVNVALDQINIAEAARQAGVPESTLRYDVNKVRAALPETLANHKPGPKPQAKMPPSPEKSETGERPATCPRCQSNRLWKNGTYWILNWTTLLMGWQGVQRVLIQRWRCATCGLEIPSPERVRQTLARRVWRQVVKRLIALSRFKLALSTRKTQLLVAFVYARRVSLGFIEQQTHRLGARAEAALQRLSRCRQEVARFLLYDETFPKLGRRVYSLGVAIYEHGLIRSVRCLCQKAKDIPAQLRAVVGEHFQPQCFLTDLEVTYGKHLARAGLSLKHLHDLVHLMRQVIRLFDEAVRDVTLDVPKGLPLAERKKQHQLKRRLLRKQLQPMLAVALKAFSPGYESVCVLMLQGVVSQLRDPRLVIQTSSVQTLANRLQRFVNKHGDTINTLLQLAVSEGTPKTTNSLESKNGIFKPFSLIARFFPQPTTCQKLFAGVALMEDKTRGPHKGTNAMQRAGINLADFGATDFFEAVGLPKSQISLAIFRVMNHPEVSEIIRITEAARPLTRPELKLRAEGAKPAESGLLGLHNNFQGAHSPLPPLSLGLRAPGEAVGNTPIIFLNFISAELSSKSPLRWLEISPAGLSSASAVCFEHTAACSQCLPPQDLHTPISTRSGERATVAGCGPLHETQA